MQKFQFKLLFIAHHQIGHRKKTEREPTKRKEGTIIKKQMQNSLSKLEDKGK